MSLSTNERREVKRSYQRRKRIEKRKLIAAYLHANPCSDCGETDIRCLDFHHVDPSEKEYGISRMVQDRFPDHKILEEIAKCIILCANCHRKEHARQYELICES